MTDTECDGCGRRIVPAGNIVNVWSFDERKATEGTGLILELTDETTHELCFPCIELLPDDATDADVDALAERDLEHADRPVAEDPSPTDLTSE